MMPVTHHNAEAIADYPAPLEPIASFVESRDDTPPRTALQGPRP